MTSIYAWSLSAGSNGNSDSAIAWPEGQTPGSVNNSARAVMGRVAEFRDDITGALLATGTANGIVVTPNSNMSSLANGRMLAVRAASSNTTAVTLNANSLGAKPVRLSGDRALSGGEIQSGSTHLFVYNATLGGGSGAWQLLNPYAGRTTVLATGALTHSGELFGQSITNLADLTGNDIYDPIFPSVAHYDTFQGVVDIANGSTIEHAVGVSGYVRNDDASTNGVALFGAGTATRNGAKIWGLNTLLMDAATRTAGTATGRYLVNELDFNVMNPGTEVIGLSIGGNSLAQPTVATGFIVNTLGNGNKWGTGFYSIDGAATIAMAIGALATSGTDIDSQPLWFQYFNGAGTKKTLLMYAQTNEFVISNDDTDLTLRVQGFVNVPTAKGYAIDGNQVLNETTLALDATGAIKWDGGEVQILHAASTLTFGGTGAVDGLHVMVLDYAAADSDSPNLFFRKARGNLSSLAVVNSGDALLKLLGQGYDGSAYQSGGLISIEVDGTPGSTDMPGRIVFWTTPDGSASLTEAMRIDSAQNLRFGSASIAANGSVATALSSVGPAGANTTVQEWLKVKNNSGTVRYIPMF